MEEKREEQYVKEVTSGILEPKKEERGRSEVQNNNNITQNHNHNNHNQSWYRLRGKFGRFVSTSTATIYKN
jgi:hypothetical protein